MPFGMGQLDSGPDTLKADEALFACASSGHLAFPIVYGRLMFIQWWYNALQRHAVLVQAKAGITPDIVEAMSALSTNLSATRKKRAISPHLTPVEAMQNFSLLGSHPLHKTTQVSRFCGKRECELRKTSLAPPLGHTCSRCAACSLVSADSCQVEGSSSSC